LDYEIATQEVTSTNGISRQENLKITEKEKEKEQEQARERDNGRDIVKRKETLNIWFLE